MPWANGVLNCTRLWQYKVSISLPRTWLIIRIKVSKMRIFHFKLLSITERWSWYANHGSNNVQIKKDSSQKLLTQISRLSADSWPLHNRWLVGSSLFIAPWWFIHQSGTPSEQICMEMIYDVIWRLHFRFSMWWCAAVAAAERWNEKKVLQIQRPPFVPRKMLLAKYYQYQILELQYEPSSQLWMQWKMHFMRFTDGRQSEPSQGMDMETTGILLPQPPQKLSSYVQLVLRGPGAAELYEDSICIFINNEFMENPVCMHKW